MGQLAGFSELQEGAIGVCEAQRDAAVHIIDLQNLASASVAKAAQPRPWWRFW